MSECPTNLGETRKLGTPILDVKKSQVNPAISSITCRPVYFDILSQYQMFSCPPRIHQSLAQWGPPGLNISA
ncbi:Uncharacterized protein HZ326_19498 [Fusarium oxysporum f. sp. albedinis]|nr:Uncharacterized protein HZ326_19498 [Fusarium oxysporum f. sp. albedinis]